jgi:peptidoglycan/xylan/chitin deacetylase (PgdA/CDA1 family)
MIRGAFAGILLLAGCGILPVHGMENGGLESGLEKWEVRSSPAFSVEAAKEAASIGETGLRLKILSLPAAGEILSPRVPVTAGHAYRAGYWSGGGGALPASASIEMVFFDEQGAALPPGTSPPGKKARTAAIGGPGWNPGELAAIAPDAAQTVAVRIKPMAGGPGSAVDFDDLRIEEIPAAASTPAPVLATDSPRIQELKAEIQRNPTRGKAPPKIILKLDDLKPATGGGVSPQWLRVADFAKEKNIKISIGIIAQGLEADCPGLVEWIQKQHAAGQVEFWNHGWDHAAGEKLIREFSGQPYEHQKDHLSRANAIARGKLGFPFVSFGAPFNATDASTVRVLSEDPDIKVWIFGDSKNPAGKAVLPSSAVTIETRARPDFEAFLEAYAHNRGSSLFVMQGHPGGWKDDNFEQFRLMVDFLISQNAQFVLPKEFARN